MRDPFLVNNPDQGGVSLQDAGVVDKVRRVLEKHAGDERMLDGYWQWASNPTPPSAGYALEENCGFISTNLLTRYERPAIDLVTQIAAECSELRKEASVYDLRQAIYSVLNGEVGTVLREGMLGRLGEPSPARQLLAAWVVNRARWNLQPGREAWVAGEFDWALGIDLQASGRDLSTEVARAVYGEEATQCDLCREALAVGLINRMFYRNVFGRMEPKVRPGPRIPLAAMTY